MVHPREAARHAGIDLYGDRYRTLWDAPLALALPDGNAPGFNDNGGGNVLRMADLYEILHRDWDRKVLHVGRAAGKVTHTMQFKSWAWLLLR
jgi:hypothetical protein